jgi:branched-chain amino acid transport system permease protein
MMRAIRDNETAAEAMGKDVKARHLQVFVLGSAVMRVAGAMMTTLDGQLDARHLPAAALHLPDLGDGDRRRVGQQLGRGAGRVPDLVALGQVEPLGRADATDHGGMPEGMPLRAHLLDSAAYMRLFTMGLILLLVLRFSPRGPDPGSSIYSCWC